MLTIPIIDRRRDVKGRWVTCGGKVMSVRLPLPNQREAVILNILLRGELYGREIRERYGQRIRGNLPLGSLYVTLDRMEDKGFVSSRMGESTHERGGNRRKYYRLTGAGVRALNNLREVIEAPAGKGVPQNAHVT
jgi:PadR family transcriptional regulator PadR